MIWESLNAELNSIKADIADLRVRTERSETTSGHLTATIATVPLAGQGVKAGDELWISDGNQGAEYGGGGSGVMAYYDPPSNSWLRIADGGAVNSPFGRIPNSTLANAPLATDGAVSGMLWFITNGRKSGELAGAGTGVVAFYQASVDSWYAIWSSNQVLI